MSDARRGGEVITPSQTVGPFGYTQRTRQMNCEWLVERQLSQGRQPDCTRKPRPNDPADWQRR